MEDNVFFENIRETYLDLLQEANTSIRVAMAWFTDKEIFDLLCEKVKNGVNVEIVISDDEINFAKGIDFKILIHKGGSIKKVCSDDEYSLMHNKFCIIDNVLVISGSYNWSYQAQRNFENIVVYRSKPDVTNKFLAEFNKLRALSEPIFDDSVTKESAHFDSTDLEDINLLRRWFNDQNDVWKTAIIDSIKYEDINQLGDGLSKKYKYKLTDILNLTQLSFYNKNIESIGPLAVFQNLKYLNLHNCSAISDFSPLKKLRSLNSLTAEQINVNIHNILEFIVENRNITKLDLRKMRITTLNPIINFDKLEFLTLKEIHSIKDLNLISTFSHLKSLRLLSRGMKHIVDLNNAKQLKYLSIEQSYELGSLYDLSFMSQLHHLEELRLSDTKINSIDILENMRNLKELNLWNSEIRNIDVLGDLSNLEDINIGYNKIRSLEPLYRLKNLKSLKCSFNKISKSDVLKLNRIMPSVVIESSHGNFNYKY